ncbi:MAG: hypothetical protein MUP80_09095 [Acidobacteriia bacterium]|nr:hypothetical protein [Terriglobia bacterium]
MAKGKSKTSTRFPQDPLAVTQADTDSIERLPLDSQGIGKNRTKEFVVTLSGSEIYFLLKLLEELAVSTDSYLKVRDAVFFAEGIRKEVKERGF